ncbi:tail fiber domain-containing protein [Dysgonomonas sp. 511]|uniref:tail fiber domain-containing protein n=1 Tax=Dysgonomonas sp. 511 TaxID=2302930 RepID=UPI0013CFFE3F|nr:tail fiber domain-containing protein [Dysgonomonas sp. 511]NDV78130.1 hypothetical protein [Dysgonomonas sp. 511]
MTKETTITHNGQALTFNLAATNSKLVIAGIGTSAASKLQITGGHGVGRVLKSDANGNAYWGTDETGSGGGGTPTSIAAEEGLYADDASGSNSYTIGINTAGVKDYHLHQMGAINNQVLTWNGSIWKPTTVAVQGAQNGLTLNTAKVELGGNLTKATTITHSGNTLAFDASAASSKLQIKTADATPLGKYLQAVDNNGTVAWATIPQGTVYSVNNGLSPDASDATKFQLGGNLTKATTITQGANNFTINTGTGIFQIDNSTTGGKLQIKDGQQALDKVLTSDADGNAAWQENPNWKLKGNSSTTAGTNFLGTIDDVALMFKTNSKQSGYISNSSGTSTGFGYQTLSTALGTRSIAIGHQALPTGGTDNVAIGYQAQNTATGANNVAIGSYTLKTSTGGNNIAIGYNALKANTTGVSNIAIGNGALAANTISKDIVAIGNGALAVSSHSDLDHTIAIGSLVLSQNTTGGYNTAVGGLALRDNITGGSNSALGYAALASNTTGGANVAIGLRAMEMNNTGNQNVAMGFDALRYYARNDETITRQASYNVAVGHKALSGQKGEINYGYENVAVGYMSMTLNTVGIRNTAIGYRALGSNKTGIDNVAIGNLAMHSHDAGEDNVAVGSLALRHNKSGRFNTAIGKGASEFGTLGTGNTTVGNTAGNGIEGDNNVMIGFKTVAMLEHWNGVPAKANNLIVIGTEIFHPHPDAAFKMESGKTVNSVLRIGDWIIGDKTAVDGSGNVRLGINGSSKSTFTFYVNGTAGGDNTWNTASDRRLKKNIKDMGYGLSEILKLRPVTYLLKKDSTNSTKVGFIAQEVKPIIPEVVSGVEGDMEKGETLSIGYSELVPVLTKAIQEQQGIIESQQQTIDKQQKAIDALLKRVEALEKK